MNIEEKFNKIEELFSKRDLINQEIKDIIGVSARDHEEEVEPVEKKSRKKGGWSRKFDKCIGCGSAKNKHKTGGFCSECFSPKVVKHYNDTGEILEVHKKPRKKYKDMPESSASSKYKCEECGSTFDSVLDYLDVRCPECKASRVIKI